MKTIEEKAKAYDEALDRARVYWETDDDNTLDIKARGTMEYLFPELAESEDEKIRRLLISGMKNLSRSAVTFASVPIKDVIDWLEKQGEQKPIDKIQLGKKYKCIASPRYSTFRRGNIYKPVDNFLCNLMNLCYECFEPIEDSEQKPADKVEPKFKVGDWVVNDEDGDVQQIIEIQRINEFIFYKCDNIFFNKPAEKYWRLWTINDAKPGDVLKEDSCTFIIERMNPDGTAIIHCCLFDDGDFDLGSTLSFDVDSTYPATKEQRDLLFQKMRESGYEWDSKNKMLNKIHIIDEDKAEMDYCFTKMMNGEKVSPKDEEYNGEDYGIDGLWHAMNILERTLGKVDGYQTDDGFLSHQCAITAVKKLYEQKSATWSKEDERMFDYALDMIEWYSGKNGDKSKLVSDWLKSLKDRVQPKHEWSEEDEARLQSCLNILQAKGFMGITETINTKWLKSLKQRYTWKPSDEQLYILNWLATNVLGDGVVDKKASEILYTLYDDLKKLKG